MMGHRLETAEVKMSLQIKASALVDGMENLQETQNQELLAKMSSS